MSLKKIEIIFKTLRNFSNFAEVSKLSTPLLLILQHFGLL